MELYLLCFSPNHFSCSLLLDAATAAAELNTFVNLHAQHFCIIVMICETKKQLLINFGATSAGPSAECRTILTVKIALIIPIKTVKIEFNSYL